MLVKSGFQIHNVHRDRESISIRVVDRLTWNWLDQF